MPENCYIYAADVYCEACGEDIRKFCKFQGFAPKNPDDETTYDSGNYPKGPFPAEASDSPEHCGSGDDCLDPYVLTDGTKIGKFLENDLTTDGRDYVKELHKEDPTELTEMWMTHYDLEDDTPDVCETCGEELDNDCQGEPRCSNCDDPCPSCNDGGGPS